MSSIIQDLPEITSLYLPNRTDINRLNSMELIHNTDIEQPRVKIVNMVMLRNFMIVLLVIYNTIISSIYLSRFNDVGCSCDKNSAELSGYNGGAIRDLSITDQKILSVSGGKLIDGSVTTNKIADNGVTDSKISSISSAKITGSIPNDLTTTTGSLDGSKIITGSIYPVKIASDQTWKVQQMTRILVQDSKQYQSVVDHQGGTVAANSNVGIRDLNCDFMIVEFTILVCTTGTSNCEGFVFKCYGGNTISDNCILVYTFGETGKLINLSVVSNQIILSNSELTDQYFMMIDHYIFKNPIA